MDRTFLLARIDATKTEIVAYEDAITAFAASNIYSYTIDTGQSRQTVTRTEISSLNKVLDSLYNRLATLEARLNGASVNVRPLW